MGNTLNCYDCFTLDTLLYETFGEAFELAFVRLHRVIIAVFEVLFHPHFTEEVIFELVCWWPNPDDEFTLLIPKSPYILLKKAGISGLNEHAGTCICCQIAKVPISIHNSHLVNWHVFTAVS